MVVVCESCSTRFRIDDARIPAKGRLVRCSQCKATFIAKPEDANFEDTVQEVVAEVTGSGGSPVPEPAADLFDAGGEDLGGETATRAAVPNDEERWEFDEEPRKPEPAQKSEPHFERPSAPDPAASSLDEIGDPTEWDLLRGSVEPAAREAQFVEAPEPPEPPKAREPVRRVEPVRRAEPEPFLRPLAEEPEEEVEPEPVRAPKRSSGRGAAVGRSLAQIARVALTATAWVALAGVVFTGVSPLLASNGARSTSRPAAPRTVGLADGEARGVEASFVENAFASPLFVVRGRARAAERRSASRPPRALPRRARRARRRCHVGRRFAPRAGAARACTGGAAERARRERCDGGPRRPVRRGLRGRAARGAGLRARARAAAPAADRRRGGAGAGRGYGFFPSVTSSFFGVTSIASLPEIPSLKPRMARPSPLPISGSRRPPKSSTAIARMMTSSVAPNPNMNESLTGAYGPVKPRHR